MLIDSGKEKNAVQKDKVFNVIIGNCLHPENAVIFAFCSVLHPGKKKKRL